MKLFSDERSKSILAALNRSQATIEFAPDGTILDANENFLAVVGYALSEVKGKHHSIFVHAADRDTAAYRDFWESLRGGKFQRAEYRRVGKRGNDVWLQASYNPIVNSRNRVVRIIKFATDVTAETLSVADSAGQLAAIRRSQAVIEFSMDGTILTANDIFLRAVGYTLDEIKGKHHGLFVDPAERSSIAYRDFWASLNRGEFQSAEFRRLGKDGREVWLQATYTPILDPSGRPFKAVKFATDITGQKRLAAELDGQVQAINRSQAVVEFELDGTIISANEIFLSASGYRLSDIVGKHHRMLVEREYAASAEYAEFWAQLRSGKSVASSCKGVGIGGREVWMQATYNPILDPSGRPYKIVKYASDSTAAVKAQRTAIGSANSVSSNVNSVAAAIEEMTASVSEVSANMRKSATLIDGINTRAAAADQTTGRLAEAARAMNGVTGLIQKIANQINLLSLNATIESARAGEAGKGFAVVASEVKSLANQTVAATVQIANEIQAVQAASGEVVSTLGEISTSIGDVREFVTGVANALEDQSAATKSIAENMQSAAREVADITRYFTESIGSAAA